MLQSKKLSRISLALTLFLALGFFLSLNPEANVRAAEESQFFPETGKTLSGKFLQYWRANGGLPVYGYPITEAQPEVDPETGKTFLTQWFERNRFELHPENAGTKYEVLLGLLGKDLNREALAVDQAFVPARSLSGPANYHIYFNETRHNLQGLFYQYWKDNGGLERFGYPVSELHQAVDPETNKIFLTQWFERARFEYHPENQPPYNVLLGLLGNQLKKPPKANRTLWTLGRNPQSAYFPNNIASDSNSNVYIFEYDRINDTNRLLKYDSNLQLTAILDEFNPETFAGKVRTDVNNNVYLLKSDTIIKYAADGRVLQVIKAPKNATEIADFAVDSNGDLYIVHSGLIEKIDSTGKSLLKWGINEQDVILPRIYAIALDSANNIYVAESYVKNNLAEYFIVKHDKQGKFIANSISSSRIYEAKRLYIDKQGNFYILNSSGNLVKLEGTGKEPATYYKNSLEDFTLDAQGNLYGFSSSYYYYNKPLYKYPSQAPNEVVQWGVSKDDLVNFYAPPGPPYRVGMISDAQGNLYLADQNSSTIKKLDSKGQLLASWGKQGNQSGEFSFDSGVSLGVDAAGFLYVANNGRTQKFSNSGQFVEVWGQNNPDATKAGDTIALAVDPKGYVYLAKGSDILKYDLSGKYLATWHTNDNPLAGYLVRLAVDEQGNVYALHESVAPEVEQGARRIAVQKYDFSGRFLLSFVAGVKSSYNLAGGHYATGLSVDAQGNIYVVQNAPLYPPDTEVTKFSPEGKAIDQIPSYPDSERPLAVVVSKDGSIYLYDSSLGLQKRVP